MDDPVFCQLVCGQWEEDSGRLQNIVFGLSTEGKVYKFTGSGWRELPNEVLPEVPRAAKK